MHAKTTIHIQKHSYACKKFTANIGKNKQYNYHIMEVSFMLWHS